MFGGSFDPIHHGHLIPARAIAEQIGLNRVVFIPCGQPPHKPGVRLADARHRLEMIRLAIVDEPHFELDDLELHRPGPSFTIETVDAYRSAMGSEADLFWIVGGDSLRDILSWHRISELVNRVQIVAAIRPGSEGPDEVVLSKTIGESAAAKLIKFALPTPQVEISATNIRTRVVKGQSIQYLVPDSVRSYIYAHGLYQANP